MASVDDAQIRRATAADIPALARVLARAFDQDPFYVWMVRQDAQREARALHTFRVILERVSSDLKETYTTTALNSAAVWKPPGELHLPVWQQLQLVPAFARAMGWTRLPAFLHLFQHMDGWHSRLVPEPHYYLFVLGVDPDHQRKGLGSQLLTPMLERCDREGTRAYLETSLPANVPFYTRSGFQVVEKIEREGWPKFWLMVREPIKRPKRSMPG